MADGYKNGQPDVGWWLRQIRLGLEYRKKSAFEQKWDRWRSYYRGEWKPGVLPANLFFRMVRSTVPRIYFRNPSISVTPAMPGQESAILAKLLERVDNKLIRNMRVKKQIKRMVQDAWLFGTGVGKKGFGSMHQATPEPLSQTNPMDASRRNSSMPNYVEYNYDIQPNMPWFMRAHPKTFVLPAGIDYIEDARWVCYIVERDVADIKDDPRLKNTGDLGPGTVTEEISRSRQKITHDMNVAQLYEIRDKKTGKVMVISGHNGGKVHLFEDDEFQRLRINVHNTLIFNEDDERVWGLPDAQFLEPLQLEANEIKTYQMYHRRLSIVKIMIQKGAMDEREAAKLVSPDVAPIAWTNQDPNTTVRSMETADIPTGLQEAELALRGEVRETMGFSRNEAGEYKEGSRSPTATEARIVHEASDLRVDERRDMISDMLVDMITDFHPIIFNHWTEPQVEEIIGPGGVPFWIQFRPQMLSKTNYIVKADPDQSLPETKELRENKALILYERLKANPLIDPFKLTAHLLRELHGVQFDDMMRGIPGGQGMTPNRPMSVGQYQQMLNNTAQNNPELLSGPNVPTAVQDQGTQE